MRYDGLNRNFMTGGWNKIREFSSKAEAERWLKRSQRKYKGYNMYAIRKTRR